MFIWSTFMYSTWNVFQPPTIKYYDYYSNSITTELNNSAACLCTVSAPHRRHVERFQWKQPKPLLIITVVTISITRQPLTDPAAKQNGHLLRLPRIDPVTEKRGEKMVKKDKQQRVHAPFQVQILPVCVCLRAEVLCSKTCSEKKNVIRFRSLLML